MAYTCGGAANSENVHCSHVLTKKKVSINITQFGEKNKVVKLLTTGESVYLNNLHALFFEKIESLELYY